MRLLVCNSKNWFDLNAEIRNSHIVKEIFCKEDLTKELVEELKPDFIFFPHWNWVVDEEIHENNECVVFHTAPLPFGRGGSPIQNLIMEGYDVSPVCAIRMTTELDAGAIYSSLDISLDGDLGSIFVRIKDAINALIIEIITKKPIPIPQSGVPHVFKRLSKNNNEIPVGISLKKIYDRVRMIDHPDYPNAYIQFGDARLEFSNASLEDQSLELTCKITKLK